MSDLILPLTLLFGPYLLTLLVAAIAAEVRCSEPVGTPSTVISGGRGSVPAAFCDVSLSFHN